MVINPHEQRFQQYIYLLQEYVCEQENQLMEDLGLETNFKNLGIQTEQDITQIVDNGFNPQRINNNPRRVTREALYQVFR